MSFRIRLIFRLCFLESRKLLAGSVYSRDVWNAVEWHLETTRIGDLRDQTNVSKRNVSAAGVGPSREQAFQRSKAFDDPVVIPGVNLGLLVLKLALEVLQGDEIVERMNVTGDQLCNCTRFGTTKRFGRQQGRVGVHLVQILDNRQGLSQHLTIG